MVEKRNGAIDLIRFLAMLGVVSLHVFAAVNTYEINIRFTFVTRIIYTLIYCSVNIFAIISGYLYLGKRIKLKSLIDIYAATLFWCILLTVLAKVWCGTLGMREFITYIFPYSTDRLWYITCYTFCFVMIPFMNVLIEKLSKTEFNTLLIVLFFLLSITSTFSFGDRFHIVSNGYSGFWLCYMFLWGGYFQKYGFPTLKTKNAILIMLSNAIMMLVSVYILERILSSNSSKLLTFYMYSSPLIVVNSLLLFKLLMERFENVKTNKPVSWLSSVSLGVYLIHAHPFILDRVLIFDNFKMALGDQSWAVWLLSSLILIILIYLFCGLLEQIRKCIFRLFHIDRIVSDISNAGLICFRKIEFLIEKVLEGENKNVRLK